MRKRYLHDSYGKDDQFWDLNWKNAMTASANEPTLNHVLTRNFIRWFPAKSKVLEGGCGDCGYLRFLAENGFDVTGVDFARRTVEAANNLWPELDVREGNILALDFPESHFDGYYSGGVIEHFESGFGTQLVEAHRVLKPNAIFAVTVPHLNGCRRAHDMFVRDCVYKDLDGRDSIFRTNVRKCIVGSPPPGFHFHEYMLSSTEMRRLLVEHRFEIIYEQAFAMQWGLLDQTWFRHWMSPEKAHRNVINKSAGALVKLIKRVERGDSSLGQYLARVAGMATGHMKLYVCRALKR